MTANMMKKAGQSLRLLFPGKPPQNDELLLTKAMELNEPAAPSIPHYGPVMPSAMGYGIVMPIILTGLKRTAQEDLPPPNVK